MDKEYKAKAKRIALRIAAGVGVFAAILVALAMYRVSHEGAGSVWFIFCLGLIVEFLILVMVVRSYEAIDRGEL